MFPEGYLECSEERAKEKGEPFQKLLYMLIAYVIPILTICCLTTLAVSWVIASQALREGAAKLRKQGHIDKKKEEKLTGAPPRQNSNHLQSLSLVYGC